MFIITSQLFPIKYLIFVARGGVLEQRQSNDTFAVFWQEHWPLIGPMTLGLQVSRNEEISWELFIAKDLAHTSHSSLSIINTIMNIQTLGAGVSP